MCEPGSPEMRAPRETDCGKIGSAEPLRSRRRRCRHQRLDRDDDRTPRGQRRRHARRERAVKARNRSRVAEALPHSEGIAYKPLSGEIAMCPRVGRMGPIATTKCTKGGCKLDGGRRMSGAGLSRRSPRKAPLEQPAFQPYWGKLAARNDRGDRGNVGII